MPDKLAQVVDAGTAIARGLDLDETLQTVVEVAARVTSASFCALGVLDADRRISRFITTGLTDEERARLGALPTGRGILGVMIGEVRPFRLRDLSDDPRSVGFPPNHPLMRSFLGVPIEGRGEVFGNLYLTESPEGMFSDEDERVVLLLAGMAAVAIENARLYADATEQTEHARLSAQARNALTRVASVVLREPDSWPRCISSRGRPPAPAGSARVCRRSGRVRGGRPVRRHRRPRRPEFDSSPVDISDSLAGSVMLAGVAIHVDGRDPSSFADSRRPRGSSDTT